MPDGTVVIRGVFTPGTIIRLVGPVPVEQGRAGDAGTVEERMVDQDGNVGFDGLDLGERFFACGYIDGVYVEKRVSAVEEGINSAELAQVPNRPQLARLGVSGTEPRQPVVPEDPGIGVGIPSEEKPKTRESKASKAKSKR